MERPITTGWQITTNENGIEMATLPAEEIRQLNRYAEFTERELLYLSNGGKSTIETPTNAPLVNVSCSLPIDLNKVLRFDQPYSLPNILDGLIECADVLLHEKGYDRGGWERLEYCYRHAKDIVKLFEGNDS